MRSMSALLAISRPKNATVLPDVATCRAMLPATAVFPIEARAQDGQLRLEAGCQVIQISNSPIRKKTRRCESKEKSAASTRTAASW
jgi:hypothetical protein